MKYQLCNEYVQAEFDNLGGVLTSLKMEGIEYLWQPDERYWKGQSPVMFPICGSIRNEEAIIGEHKKCHMPRHGFARFEEFEQTVKTNDSISFTLCSNEETLSKYPYPFKLTITYTLQEKTLSFLYTVETIGQETMPFFVGGHPGFRCPLKPEEEFSDYQIEFEYAENANCPYPAQDPLLLDSKNRREILKEEKVLQLDHDLFLKDGLVFDALKSRKVVYSNPKTGMGLRVEFDDFPNLVLWSAANQGPFIAIEPWLGTSTWTDEDDVFEHKRGVQFVAPGEKKKYLFSISVL